MVCVVKHKWFASGLHNVSTTHMCPWYTPYDQYIFFGVSIIDMVCREYLEGQNHHEVE
jgi:hypothetical protein